MLVHANKSLCGNANKCVACNNIENANFEVGIVFQ